MIFVTVGTHEQQFNRLLKEIDYLKKSRMIKEKVFMQIGYSDYIPQYCEYGDFLSYKEIEIYIKNASTVITHGGPASFMKVISLGKIPIVVPRLIEFKEHVNNHQLEFAKKVVEKGYPIQIVENISQLKHKLESNHNFETKNIISHNYRFNQELGKEIKSMMSKNN